MLFQSPIEQTADSVFYLNGHSSDKNIEGIVEYLTKNYKLEATNLDFAGFTVSRHTTMFEILESLIFYFKSKVQIIELGAGFTKHFLNLKQKPFGYIEVDLPANYEIKNKVIKDLFGDFTLPLNTYYKLISGDILDLKTWKDIKNTINLDIPVIIFSEGVVSHFFSKDQKLKLIEQIKPILNNPKSFFIFDDSLRYHPEIATNKYFENGIKKVMQKSKTNVYTQDRHGLIDDPLLLI